jgi:ribA/ribD-fused uncharacterized protein
MPSIIRSFTGKFAFMNPIHRAGFFYEGDEYQSTAAAFEAAKILNRQDRVSFWRWNCKPWDAKRLGKGIPQSWMRPDWDAVQFDVMTDIMRSKFSMPDLRRELLATRDAEIVYENSFHDNVWGACLCRSLPANDLKYGRKSGCTGSGNNRLGQILIQVRLECSAGLHVDPLGPLCAPALDFTVAA